MKARRKGTNNPFREIEMASIKDVEGLYLAEELEFEQEPTPDHWQDVRERAAIAAMQCIIKELYREKSYTLEEEKVARYSVCYADALVKKTERRVIYDGI